ncbi:MAG: adaptor protein MecA [Oscillospiraceae bacterium]|nr:adaptor protein MecA [Oscillospiraceae bacterium]
MEYKLVNENKLKIILTNEDMALLDITPEEMDYDNTGTKRIFWEILDNAKHQIGFDAGSEKLFVQVYPDKNGGCMMYVTKDVQKSVNTYNTYEKKYKSKVITGAKKKRLLYMFENSEILLEACDQLNLTGYTGKSDLYADENRYFLYIEDNKEQAIELISEYGILINYPFFGFYLDEHTKKIISSDAVKTFSEIFKR